MLQRIFAFLILAFSVFFMPYWMSLILALAGIVYFSYFVEAVALFLVSDLLYGVKEAKFYDVAFVAFVAAILCVVLAEMLKKKLKFHSKYQQLL